MRKKIAKILALSVVSIMSFSAFAGCSMDTHYYGEGRNAYQIAVDNGFVGTEQEWLASLVGAQGEKGETGDSGVSVKDVQITYETDDNGTTYMVFTFTYTDDTTSVVKTIIPKAASTTEDLVSALSSGETVVLTSDVETAENIVMDGGSLNGNGNTIDGSTITERVNCAITTTGGTVENVNIIGAPRGLGTGSSGQYALSQDLIINNVYIDVGTYAINVGNGNGYQMLVSNSTLYGWTSYSELSLATFDGCTFGQGQTDYAYIRMYDATKFTDCIFEVGFKLGANAVGFENEEGFAITLTNCYYGEELITAENFAELLTDADDEDTESLKHCTIMIDGVAVVW